MPTALVTGAAGFLGSHLVDRLLLDGWRVLGVDDLSTGRRAHLAAAAAHPRFSLHVGDAASPPDVHVDRIYHLACAASPVDFETRADEITHACGPATEALLAHARRHGARLLLASTSEVYGQPDAHPQREDTTGHIDATVARSVYATGKRRAEALCRAAERDGASVRIARIFNSYGPRMRPDDGRVVVTFLQRALEGAPLPVHGDGTQTRSLCYCTDTVDGLVALMESDLTGPCNLGRPEEVRMIDLARRVIALTESSSSIVHEPRSPGDPDRRRPDIRRATSGLGWEPSVALDEGLRRMLGASYSRNCTPPTAPTV